MSTPEQVIAAWRKTATEEAYFSASRVQDRLFDLYGVLGEGRAKRLVETWLTLTIQRDLFSGAELVALLDEIEATTDSPAPDSPAEAVPTS